MRFWRFCWEILRRGRSLGIKRSSPFSKAAKTGFWWILPKQVLVNFVRTGFCEFCQNRFRRIFSNQVSDNGHFGDDHLFPLRNQQDGIKQMRSVLKKVAWSLYPCNWKTQFGQYSDLKSFVGHFWTKKAKCALKHQGGHKTHLSPHSLPAMKPFRLVAGLSLRETNGLKLTGEQSWILWIKIILSIHPKSESSFSLNFGIFC